MGFYDNEIKRICENLPRLLILAINSVFGKEHDENSEVLYLNREQLSEGEENAGYMDLYVGIEDCRYHFEFQMLEDEMALRMYEYAAKESIRTVRFMKGNDKIPDGDMHSIVGDSCSDGRYEIDIVMPRQLVIFLSGSNTKDEIIVNLTLPDGKSVSYSIPCISAALPAKELAEMKMMFLIPFQQAQLNDKMNHIKGCSQKTKKEIAKRLFELRDLAKTTLEELLDDGIISLDENRTLLESTSNVSEYIVRKDDDIAKEVRDMGDEGYVALSDRIRAEGKAEGKAEGRAEGRAEGMAEGRAEERAKRRTEMRSIISRIIDKGNSIQETAELTGMPIEEIEDLIDKSK